MNDFPNGSHVAVSAEWQAPYNSAYDNAGATTYAGKSGIVQTKNTSGEYLIKFDEPGLGSYWIEEEDVKPS